VATDPIRVLELRSAVGAGGGPEKTILLGAALADRRRIDVTVCYLRDRRDRAFSIAARAERLGIRYFELEERSSFDPAIWPALRRVVRERRIDIVHAHEYKTDLLAWALSRADGVAAMATVHGWIRNTARERLYYHVDRRVLTRLPLVVAVSEQIRRTLIAQGAAPQRVKRLLNGVDCAHFRPTRQPKTDLRARLGVSPDALVLGSVGRLGAEKRFDLLIDAAARLAPAPVIVIAGEGPDREDLMRFATQRSVDLRLLGHREDVRELYEAVDLFVQSSDTEGIPNVLLEAMAMHTPIVATDVGGTREIVNNEEHGLLVPRRDVDAMVAAINRTITEQGATARRTAAARARVERELSFSARTARLEAMYEELAGRRRMAA
jgi:glycosyltransferase involved in cell wall biosynthesis